MREEGRKEGRRERIIGDEGRGGRLTLLTERKEIRKWKEREGVESVGKNKKEEGHKITIATRAHTKREYRRNERRRQRERERGDLFLV